ncbi:MAG: Lrp/AsnC ligand binding domain-containing protein [Chloroflexota bacterium]
MRLSDVLAQVEGLNRRFVYYLEAQGYIRPTKIQKARIARRDYSPEDAARIQDVWAYYRRGYSVQGAVEMVDQAQRLSAYVLLSVPERRWAETLDLLAGLDRVQEASIVYGETANAIARVAAPDDVEIYGVLNQVFDRELVAGVPRILKVRSRFVRSKAASERAERTRGLQAYLLIKVPAKHAGGVLEQLKELPGVAEASVIYGETDIVARVVASNQDALDDVILNQIQGLPAVESTRTFIVVGRLQWRRDA